MNYLAHVYLSGDDKHLAIGNFIADKVKGKQFLQYPQTIQNGILLHRKIDSFTDSHLLFKKNVTLLFPIHRHYSRVIVDLFFDHYLAANWHKYHHLTLKSFSVKFYDTIQNYEGKLPESILKMIPSLIKYDWFSAYASIDGLENILFQMSRRTRFESNMDYAIKQLNENYQSIANDFQAFFEAVKSFSQKEIANL